MEPGHGAGHTRQDLNRQVMTAHVLELVDNRPLKIRSTRGHGVRWQNNRRSQETASHWHRHAFMQNDVDIAMDSCIAGQRSNAFLTFTPRQPFANAVPESAKPHNDRHEG